MRFQHLLIAAGLLFSVQANANLLTNGSFESPDQPAGTWSIYSAIPGWTAGTAGVEVRDNNTGVAAHGTQFVELDTTANSWIQQDVATAVGVDYVLSFFYSPRISVSAASNIIDVLIEGGLAGSYTGVGGSAHNWSLKTIAFTASDTVTSIRFKASGASDSLGGSLDKVSLEVPEPGSLLLVGAALGLLGLRRRNS